MRPQMIQAIQTGVRFPRVSGDAPSIGGMPYATLSFSPRERGCALTWLSMCPPSYVFPA